MVRSSREAVFNQLSRFRAAGVKLIAVGNAHGSESWIFIDPEGTEQHAPRDEFGPLQGRIDFVATWSGGVATGY
jgi:hypothetical protein